MSIEPTPALPYRYVVVEDIDDVAARLVHQMNAFAEWQCAGTAGSVRKASQLIETARPQLIFCDWDLIGGSGFEVLRHIGLLKGYRPFVVFNTGFQSDHPEIAEELINTYKVDAFINKPYWQKLLEQLPIIIEHALLKAQQPGEVTGQAWLRTASGEIIKVNTALITAVVQCPKDPRQKLVYMYEQSTPWEVVLTWKAAEDLIKMNSSDYFAIHKRSAIISRHYIQRYKVPHVWVGKPPLRLEVVRDNIKAFETWMLGRGD